MSSVRFVFPKNKLAGQLAKAGGLAVADAMAAAQANLAELKPQCIEELQQLTQEAQACFARLPDTFDAESLLELYAIAARGVGAGTVCGAPAADVALVSLCDLIDNLNTHGGWDKAAVSVHLRTLQLLVFGGQSLSQAEIDTMLSGLRKVTIRFAAPKGQAAAG